MQKRIAVLVLNSFTHDSRVLKTSSSLAAAGYDVTVAAVVAPGLPGRDQVGQVAIQRHAGLFRDWPASTTLRIVRYLAFLAQCGVAYRRYDIVHCNDLDALPAGVLIKLLNRQVRIVYDAHEHETESNGLRGVRKWFKRHMERLLIRFADRVITVGDLIADDYQRMYDIRRPVVVLNCPPKVTVPSSDHFRMRFGIPEASRIFIYQGGIGPGRGIDLMLRVFAGRTDGAVLVLMGYGSWEERVKDAAMISDTIWYHPPVEPQQVLLHTASADFGISFIQDTCLSYRYSLPNKLFEYCMAGIPVLVSPLEEMRRLVSSTGVGVVADAVSDDALEIAVGRCMASDPSTFTAPLARFRETYNWEVQSERLLTTYQSLEHIPGVAG